MKKIPTHKNIYVGDVRQRIKDIPEESVHCVVTSPPYWGLRDYGQDGQVGLEQTPDEYVAEIVAIFHEVHRILRSDGTLWLNLGDSYAGNTSRASNNGRAGFGSKREGVFTKTGKGIKPKDLVGIPWRVALALQADGWYLRQDIIWHKPNPLPESVKDRCTKSHEYIFLLSKSPKYYFDHKAIAEPATTPPTVRDKKGEGYQADYPKGDRFSAGKRVWGADGLKNKRSVWTVPVKPFKEAHFATFPTALIEPCILAGSPIGGIVFDPFLGAGTVAVVAEKNNRNWLGCELNRKYAKIATLRIRSESKK